MNDTNDIIHLIRSMHLKQITLLSNWNFIHAINSNIKHSILHNLISLTVQLILYQIQREKSLFLDLTTYVFLLKVVAPALSVPLIKDVRRKKGLTEEQTYKVGFFLASSV